MQHGDRAVITPKLSKQGHRLIPTPQGDRASRQTFKQTGVPGKDPSSEAEHSRRPTTAIQRHERLIQHRKGQDG